MALLAKQTHQQTKQYKWAIMMDAWCVVETSAMGAWRWCQFWKEGGTIQVERAESGGMGAGASEVCWEAVQSHYKASWCPRRTR